MENNTSVKKKIKFNLIDFLIVIAVIAVIVVIAFRSGLVENLANNAKGKTIVYTVKIGDVQNESFNFIDIGEKLYNDETDAYIGTIVDKRVETSKVYIISTEGKIVKTEQPGRADIYLTVEAKGTVNANGCKVDGKFFVAAGKLFSCYTEDLFFNAEIRDAYEKVN